MTSVVTNAGLYGPEAILGQTGTPAANTPVTVYIHNTTTDAVLYTDNTKASAAANPVTTDGFGNLAFYADPGLYDLSFTVGGTATTLTVLVRPWTTDSSIPTGSIFDFAGPTVPAGWLACDGSAVSRTGFAELFSVIGVDWGNGDGSTTFNLPDLRGRATVGVGSVGTNAQPTLALGAVGGEQNHTLSTPEMPSHAHTDAGHTHLENPNIVSSTGSSIGLVATSSNQAAFAAVISTGNGIANIQATGGGGSHNNMQPYAAVTKMIKV